MHCAKSRAGYLFRVVVVGGGDVAVILFHFSFRLRQMNSDGITQQQYGIEEFVVFVWWVWNICMIIHNVPKERESKTTKRFNLWEVVACKRISNTKPPTYVQQIRETIWKPKWKKTRIYLSSFWNAPQKMYYVEKVWRLGLVVIFIWLSLQNGVRIGRPSKMLAHSREILDQAYARSFI